VLKVTKFPQETAPPEPGMIVINGSPVVPDLAAVMDALTRLCPDLAAYDEMARTAMIMRPISATDREDGFRPRPMTDHDVSVVQCHMQLMGMRRIGRDIMHQALMKLAHDNPYHPVRDWLDSLQWDGAERLPVLFSGDFGAEATPYTAGIGRMFMISMVARIYTPGCKVDHMPVLEGKQGTWKSTACRVLAGEWFSDHLPDIHTGGKDVSQHLRGKWLIEVSEMSAMNKAEATALKSFITRQAEQYRPSYGRIEVTERRQCVFIGTTNESAYLRDPTGGRRVWPIKIGFIDLEALKRNREQLFAEAVARFRRDERWWPDLDFEQTHVVAEQAKRLLDDVWEEAIRNYLVGKDKVLIGEIAREALHFETNRIGRADQNRIIAVLDSMAWVRLPKDGKGNIPWGKPTTQATGQITTNNGRRTKTDDFS
jgi:predicted P-loop ATPase